MVKFGTRYYNPQLGRWTQQDPVGGSLTSPDNLNRYLYVADDPVNLVDSHGTSAFVDCIVGLITGIAGIVGSIIDGFFAGLGLLDAAVGLAVLSGTALFLWVAFVVLAIIAAFGFAWAASQCEGFTPF